MKTVRSERLSRTSSGASSAALTSASRPAMQVASKNTYVGEQRGQLLHLCVVHVDERIPAHRQPHRRTRWRFGAHLVPGHRCRVEGVAFYRVKLAHTLELAADGANLNDPPLRRPRVHVAER